jgi:phosphoglycerate dehydrogenase-like enzyme
MPMSLLNLLVLADSKSAFFPPLAVTDPRVRVTVAHDPEAINATAPEADIVLYATMNSSLLTAALPFARRTQWIHSLWTGVEGILGPEMLQHPAPLTNGRGVFRWPLADWVAAVMLHFAFDLGRVIRQQQHGVWQPFISTSLQGRTLGIVGYGEIGSAAAVRARVFGMRIAALRRRRELFEGDTLVDDFFESKDLKSMLAVSDYVLVALPLTPDTRGLLGEGEIALMKPSSVLINVGRGPVIDESALVSALESGALRGAALDVFTVEPVPSGHPFWTMPNVLLSPHTADHVEGFLIPAFECFMENLKRFLSGLPLSNIVDKHAGY